MFALLCIWMCLHAAERSVWAVPALVAAFLASFSVGFGLLAWPVGLVVLLSLCSSSRRLRLFVTWIAGRPYAARSIFTAIILIPCLGPQAFFMCFPMFPRRRDTHC